MTDGLLSFYLSDGLDDRGRDFADVLRLTDAELECEHDYIQWIFPLTDRSRAVPSAPVLTAAALEALRADPRARVRMTAALNRMVAFFGLEVVRGEGVVAIGRARNYEGRVADWLGRPHNFLRITRILKSLRLMGLDDHVRALFASLEIIYADHEARIGATTWEFWRAAAAPDC